MMTSSVHNMPVYPGALRLTRQSHTGMVDSSDVAAEIGKVTLTVPAKFKRNFVSCGKRVDEVPHERRSWYPATEAARWVRAFRFLALPFHASYLHPKSSRTIIKYL
jgi:hypothetical protein